MHSEKYVFGIIHSDKDLRKDTDKAIGKSSSPWRSKFRKDTSKSVDYESFNSLISDIFGANKLFSKDPIKLSDPNASLEI